ncbi:MAG: cobalt-precorrin 5A hydrolase [Tissierellia bacterium]|nr:cobalt-precorrin 5A hydrolase [Tissierellia bacterium]
MKIALLTFSERGRALGERLAAGREGWELYGRSLGRPVGREDFGKLWGRYDGFLFIGSVGITVRYIAPHLQGKDRDPAVCTVNDSGEFVISVLSGHLGGANELAREIAQSIGAVPVITTASESRGFQSLDLFARAQGYAIERLSELTAVATAMVDGKPVAFYSELPATPDYPQLKRVSSMEEALEWDYSIVVSSRISQRGAHASAHLKPKNLHLGLGARKDAPFPELSALLEETLLEADLSILSIKDMASIDVKKEEGALLALSQKYQLPFYTFPPEELAPLEDGLEVSEFVRKTVGVGSVSGTSALKLGGELIVEKAARGGFTLSITREAEAPLE